MAMLLKPGGRLFSPVCSAEFIVVRSPSSDVEITIGGVPALAAAAERDAATAIVEGHDGGSAIGKRYVDADESIEVLCTKPGSGSLALNGEVLVTKDAKALPASD